MGELRCARSVCLPFVLSAAQHSVRRHAGHVTERPRLGFPFARSVAAEVNYSCVQIGHAILRRHPITGAVQRGNSVTHSVADATRNWCFDSGRPAELNNLRRAACRLRNAMTPRGIYKERLFDFISRAMPPAELGLVWLTLRYPLTDPRQFDQLNRHEFITLLGGAREQQRLGGLEAGHEVVGSMTGRSAALAPLRIFPA